MVLDVLIAIALGTVIYFWIEVVSVFYLIHQTMKREVWDTNED